MRCDTVISFVCDTLGVMREPTNGRVGTDADLTVAAEIRAELARQRITHAALAEQLGVSRVYVTRRLNGETPLSVGDVARIADLLGVALAQLTAPVDEHRG